MSRPSFICEAEVYRMLARAGIPPPDHGFAGARPPFEPGCPVVLKGLAEELWHKSELGAVKFLPYGEAAIAAEAGQMKARIESAGRRWIGALVCERVSVARAEGLPSEGLVSLFRHETGWIALVGLGGLQAEALAGMAPVLRWPVALMSPASALEELEGHLLGRIWLGRLRGMEPLTTKPALLDFLAALWRLAVIAEEEGASLIELNPVALRADGRPTPLDAVGRRAPPPPPRVPSPVGFLGAVMAPRQVALAGVSSRDEGFGRTILDNLRRCPSLAGNIVIVKPGQDSVAGVPCVPGVAALKEAPVDLLILALPAAAAARAVSDLLAQGGGARVVALVSGGFGDGADTAGLGGRLAADLSSARASGKWTPAILGPNFLGHWVPAIGLDTSFIPAERVAPLHPEGGSLALLGQSGAFLLCRRSRHRHLRLRLGAALGNEIDVSLADYLDALAPDSGCSAVAAYVEGFRAGDLDATLRAALRLRDRGMTLLLHRAGRTAAGQAAAASHTGAIAGDIELERAVLGRAGVRFSESIAAFDAALAWLAAYPRIARDPVALVTNAGFESVNGNDTLESQLPAARLGPATLQALGDMLEAEGLAGLVPAKLPLDLTPMAPESAYLRAAEILLKQDAGVLVLGLVPFTRCLRTEGSAGREFAGMLAGLSASTGKPIGIAVDAGPASEAYREAFAGAGLPVFARMEDALLGLRTLVGQARPS
jgi:acyl-CoA synthetase (NDP forming)